LGGSLPATALEAEQAVTLILTFEPPEQSRLRSESSRGEQDQSNSIQEKEVGAYRNRSHLHLFGFNTSAIPTFIMLAAK
jgi:hypothetical protein